MTEEREKREGTQDGVAEEEIVEGGTFEGDPVEAGLDTGAVKGPALDQDEGSIQSDPTRGSRKERVGMVVSDKPQKTAVVSVETLVRHPKYKKRVRSSKRFMVHDEQNAACVGDTVRIVETRPISARKRWRLGNIISRAE